eukprot:2521407-Prorocentrum_lima.AAC.1
MPNGRLIMSNWATRIAASGKNPPRYANCPTSCRATPNGCWMLMPARGRARRGQPAVHREHAHGP